MNININGVISGQTSYGIATLNIIEALNGLGHHITAIPINGKVEFYSDQLGVQRAVENYEAGFDLNAPSIRIYHQNSLFEHVGRGLNVGFPIFELDAFSKIERNNLNSCDALFVCSKWAKSVLENNEIQPPSYVVPLGVDPKLFYPIPQSYKPFTFYFPGKFEYRKGFDAIPIAFERAFSPSDDFQVIFLPNNYFISQEQTQQWVDHLTQHKLGDKFKLGGRLPTHKQVGEITQYADCVVSFSRAEGFNLGLLEGLACGKQVIATNYSAHTEYLTHENSILIDVEEREEAFDGIFFNGGGNWLSFTDKTIDRFAEVLRSAYDKGRIYNEEGIKTAQKFSWTNTAQTIVNSLTELGVS